MSDEYINDDVQSSIRLFEASAEEWGEKADAALHHKPSADSEPDLSDIEAEDISISGDGSYNDIGDAPGRPGTEYSPPGAVTVAAPDAPTVYIEPPRATGEPSFEFDLDADPPEKSLSVDVGSPPTITVPDEGDVPEITVPPDPVIDELQIPDYVDPGITNPNTRIPEYTADDPTVPSLRLETAGMPERYTPDGLTINIQGPELPDIAPGTLDPLIFAPPQTSIGSVADYAPTWTPPVSYTVSGQAGRTGEVTPADTASEIGTGDIAFSVTAPSDTSIDLVPKDFSLGDVGNSYTVSGYAATHPTIALDKSVNEFAYIDDPEYVAFSQFSNVATNIKAVLAGEQIIPSWVWSGIWSRTMGDLERVKQTAYREADREHASRGWGLPGGAMLARRAMAKQQYLDAATKTRWEQTLLESKNLREDLFQALSLGMAAEQFLHQIDAARLDRLLRAATEYSSSSVAAAQATAQAYSAQVQYVGAQVEEKRLFLDVLSKELDASRVEIERARAFIENDAARARFMADKYNFYIQNSGVQVQNQELQFKATELDIAAFKANADAVEINQRDARMTIDGYLAQVERAKLEYQRADTLIKEKELYLRSELSAIDAYRAKVEGFKTGLDAQDLDIRLYSAEWEGVRATLQKAGLELQVQELEFKAIGEYNQSVSQAISTNNAVDNTRISYYNAQWEGVKTEIQQAATALQKEDLALRAALGRLDTFRARLDKSKVILEDNDQQVKIYTAAWAQADAEVRAYSAWVGNVKNTVEAQQVAVEAFSENVKGKALNINRYSALWDGYGKQVDAAKVRVMAHEAETSLFGQMVSRYQAEAQSKQALTKLDIETEQMGLQYASVDLDRFKAEWAGIQTKLNAIIQVYATDGQVYAAKGQVESARVGSVLDRYRADLAEADMKLRAKIATAQRDLDYWKSEMAAMSEWQKARATVFSTLGGAAYTAANVSMGATVGYDFGSRESVNTNYNYSMEG